MTPTLANGYGAIGIAPHTPDNGIDQSTQRHELVDTKPVAPTLSTALESHEKVIAELHATIDELEKRLHGILTPEDENNVAGYAMAILSSAPHVDQVGHLISSVDAAANRIGSLIKRLAL